MIGKRVAVIGSNCFTGSHIVDAFLENPNNTVLGVSRSAEYSDLFLPYKKRAAPKFKFQQIDLYREPDRLVAALDEFHPDHVVNVAALSEVGLSNYQPLGYFQVNTLGVVALGSSLREKKYLKSFIQISTPEIYGTCNGALDESAPYNPSTPYAASKAAGDMYLTTLRKNFGFPAIFIRSTNVYGRHQQLYKIIPRSVIYMKKGQKLELHGGGQAVKTWIHVRDVARAVIKAAEVGQPGDVYHLGDRHSLSIRELVERICRLMKKDFDSCAVAVEERLGQDARYVLDYNKSMRDLGWNPRESFDRGLQEVIDWVEQNWDAILARPLVYEHKV
ncbi:MAG: hypothetical protein A3G34_11695 [Candidatus Lindowbacteria bacterium RIFCSPLOWO2_12_FULL_62_27]|nr:MAG: hypothetical protein A3I06_02260 [Candidatus Lindowbacteria bacterium RIFCSPLOWO2_02_FULL_62_12]OGH60915.1 MAG: hypothetical protein A3G34_11695 [Candidatus Lindowbacteria bacterium RIFCSPLOWO2_12_FULL_62_27]